VGSKNALQKMLKDLCVPTYIKMESKALTFGFENQKWK